MINRYFVLELRRSLLKSTFAIIALTFLTAFKPNSIPLKTPAGNTGNASSVGTTTSQALAINGSTNAYFDNATIHTYTFNSTRTPINWSITGGIILSGNGTTSVTVRWNGSSGTLYATSASVVNGTCTTINPPPTQCCWTPPSGQTCNSASNPCNGNNTMAQNDAETLNTESPQQEFADPITNGVIPPPGGQCCQTVDPPPYQDCNYVRHVGSLSVSALACPIVAAPLVSTNHYTIFYGQSVVLQASLSNGTSSIRWYDQPTGGTLVHEGLNYTTPPINVSSSAYYAESYTSLAPPSPMCSNTSSRVSVTITASCMELGTPTFAQTAQHISYGNTVTIQATLGSNGTGIRWYTQSSGGIYFYEGLTYVTPALNTSSTTYYIESYGTSVSGCANTSTRVPVTITASCPTMGIPGFTVPNSEVVYGKSVAIQAAPGTNGTGIRWYDKASGGAVLYEGTHYVVSPYSNSFTYYLESFTISGTITCASSRVPVNIIRPSYSTVLTEHIRAGQITTDNQITNLPSSQKDETVLYLDGLGRLLQQVQVASTPTGNDMIAPMDYDASGRQPKHYLPYTMPSNGGFLRSDFAAQQAAFYATPGNKVADDAQPFSQTVFEASPVGRVLEQGAPGTDRQPGSGHTSRITYTFNDANEVRNFPASGVSTTFFAANTLSKSISTSPDGKLSIVFTDGRGRTVLKKQQLDETIAGAMVDYLETYYIYNDLNQLLYILPPKAVALLQAGAWLFTDAIKNDVCYRFIYDSKGRVMEKKAPGQGWMYYVYDDLGRLVLMQDANLIGLKKWVYVKYDQKGRVVSTGLYKNLTQLTRASVQGLLNNVYKATNATYPENAWYESPGTILHGYTNNSFPKTNADDTALEVLNVNYYDSYDFDANGTPDFAYAPQGLAGEAPVTAITTNLPTGSKRLVLGTTTWLTTAVFYDSYHRPVQVRKNNHLNTDLTTTANLTTSVYDFEGKTLTTKNYHHAGSGKITTVINRMEYDAKGRLLNIYQNNNATAEQLVAQYEYNELGQVVDKKLHNTNGTDFLQSIDYRYTLLGQLASINNAQLTNDLSTNDEVDDYFGMELLYNTTESGLNNAALFDGNISAIKYKGMGDGAGAANQHSYTFAYDKAGQLKSATSKMHSGTAWNKELNTQNESFTYDHNGNTLTLQRNQRNYAGSTYAAQTIDNLAYTYASGNKLSKVEDATANTVGFKNGANTTTEYTYDVHGSLLTDQNKGVSATTYNFLGKPTSISFSDGKRIDYTYDAAGSKLTMKTYQGSTLQKTIDYIDNFVYENGALSFFGSPEGRVVAIPLSPGEGTGVRLEYQYAIADNQGNTRVVFSSAAPAPVSSTANMEATSNGNFQNYNNRVGFDLMDHTDAGTTYTYSQKLSGGYNSQIGLAKSFKIYPGDKVKVEAYAKYTNASSTSSNLTGFASALLAAFGAPTPAGGETGTASSALNNWGSLVAGGNGPTSTGPKAFVNIIIFDKNYNLLDITYEAIDPVAEQVGISPVVAHDNLMREYVAKQEGYAFVYLSNENATLVDVYFDDVTMTHTPTNVLQYNEYYPFGLQTSNSWTRENTTQNNYLYNDGNELNQTSGWYEMFYRGYDPVLGRMLQVDPYAHYYSSYSPYNYAANNPIMINDPSGGLLEMNPAITRNEWLENHGWVTSMFGGGSGGGGGGMGNTSSGSMAAQIAARDYAAFGQIGAGGGNNQNNGGGGSGGSGSSTGFGSWEEVFAYAEAMLNGIVLPEVEIEALRQGDIPDWWGNTDMFLNNNWQNNGSGQKPNLLDTILDWLPGERYNGSETLVSVGTNVQLGIKRGLSVTVNPFSQVLTNNTYTNRGNTFYKNSSTDGTVRLHQEFGFDAGFGFNYKNIWETRNEIGHLDGMYKSDVYEFTASFFGLAVKVNWGSEDTSVFYGLNVGAGIGLGIGGSAETWHGNVIKIK